MAVKKTVDKFKKKKWFTLIAPKIFEGKTLGETPAEKSNLAIGRTINVSVDELTGQRKLRHITAKFKVIEVKELNALTELIGFEINNSYLRRMVRRRISKIETIVTATTKNGKKARVKAVAISSKRLEKTKEKEIRKIIRETILSEIPKKNFDVLAHEMIFGITSTEMLQKTKGIDKLRRLEITKARVLEGK